MKAARKDATKSKTSDELTDASPMIGQAIEAPDALPPLPATAAQYAEVLDPDILIHRLFEIRRRNRLFEEEAKVINKELIKRLLPTNEIRTARYHARLVQFTSKEVVVPAGDRTRISIELRNPVGARR